jgi:PleD family two-component response regulator
MANTFNTPDKPVNITLSIGLIESWLDCTFELLYSQSDIALYRAKNNGRNQVIILDKFKSNSDISGKKTSLNKR